MHIKKNLDKVRAVQKAGFQGKTPEEMVSYYVERNAFDVALDTPIYRIMELEHLKTDIDNKTLTHVKACKETWGDEYENPLLQVTYKEELTGESLSLAPIVDDMYGLSWTLDKNESAKNWSVFSYGNTAVRIKSTPRKLMTNLMNLNDKFHMLHHYIGKVFYYSEQEILDFFKKTPYEYFLDSLGQGAVLSLMGLRNIFSSEKEIRLLYSHQPESSNWVKKEVVLSKYLCPVPFVWENVIDEVMFSSATTNKEKEDIKKLFLAKQVNTSFADSKL